MEKKRIIRDLSVKMDASEFDSFKMACEAEGRTISKTVRELMRSFVKEHSGGEAAGIRLAVLKSEAERLLELIKSQIEPKQADA